MSIEAQWYSSYVDGAPPKMRRLCRLPMADQWRAAIDIAISFARGEAGYRQTHHSRTGEAYWYWPASGYALRSANAIESDWWMIPPRVEKRVFALQERAVQTAMRGRGRCSQAEVIAVLERWKHSRHWYRVVAGLWSRHEPAKRTKAQDRRDNRIADIHAKVIRKRYCIRIADIDGNIVWAQPAAAEAVREMLDRNLMDECGEWNGECLNDRLIERIVASGGMIEEVAACAM